MKRYNQPRRKLARKLSAARRAALEAERGRTPVARERWRKRLLEAVRGLNDEQLTVVAMAFGPTLERARAQEARQR